MKIIVLVKQTFDTEAKLTLDNNGKIDGKGVKLIMNPYDEYAVEEGLRIKEKTNGEVTVISVDKEQDQDALRQAIAMGADEAVMVVPGDVELDEYSTATILAKVISKMEYDIILGGFRAIDDGSCQVAGRVAESLNIPVVNMVTEIKIENDKVQVTRDIEGGSEVIEVKLPAVLTAQKGLNEPRYPSMKGIMKAKKKPIKIIGLDELGLAEDQLAARVKPVSFTLAEPRKAGKIIQGEPAKAASQAVRLILEKVKVVV